MYDSKADTLEHIQMVQMHMTQVIMQLLMRGQTHDQSKLEAPEKPYFDEFTPLLSSVPYGSEEYKAITAKMGPALAHHYAENPHHPEHNMTYVCDACFEEFDELPPVCDKCGNDHFEMEPDIEKMSLIDILEMLPDWKSSTLRSPGGDIRVSLEKNAKRYGIPQGLAKIILNTIDALEW